MNTEYEANKTTDSMKDKGIMHYYNNKPYVALNDDYSKKYKSNQYCTVLTPSYNFVDYSTSLCSMSTVTGMEILNLPITPFKRDSMGMLIKEIMANSPDMRNPFDGDYKRAFFCMIIDVAHRVSKLSQNHNAFIINSDAGAIEYDKHCRFYLRSNTTIEKLGYDTTGLESVFEYEDLGRSIILFTLDTIKHPEGRDAVIVIINLKEDD